MSIGIFCVVFFLFAIMVTGLFVVVAHALRPKSKGARTPLQEARAQGTIFLIRSLPLGENASPRPVASIPTDKDYALRLQQVEAHYRRYQGELLHQSQFEAQNTIELPVVPQELLIDQEVARETGPIRKYHLVRDTEGVRSVFPPHSN